jgi:hypothetical protein
MSVIPPSFPELVAESSSIIHARVTASECRKVNNGQGEVIMTLVTFQVSKSLKGTSAGAAMTLSFLGGQVGDEGTVVPGMPTFEIGAEEFLFVSPQGGVCPLVGAMHGRYHVYTTQKSERPYVARDDGSALVRVSDIVRPMKDLRALDNGDAALTPPAFEALIAAEVAHPSPSTSKP